jgi:hypothetical protein
MGANDGLNALKILRATLLQLPALQKMQYCPANNNNSSCTIISLVEYHIARTASLENIARTSVF